MPHFMIALISYISLLNISWIIKCLFLRNIEPLNSVDNHLNLIPCDLSDGFLGFLLPALKLNT